MRSTHARTQEKGQNINFDAENAVTRAIDAQTVIAPQYGIGAVSAADLEPSNQSYKPGGTTTQSAYCVHKESRR